MFHDIKLDDRSFEEIRDEAISKIVDHCPDWTNHNASDPGITLIELFSYMTELTQYRLNQVPQKNYLAFLDLLGIKQRLPIAAKSRVKFSLSTGFQIDQPSKESIFVKQGSVLASVEDEENESLTYETTKDLYISNSKLVNVYSKSFDKERQKSKIIDYTNNIEQEIPFYPFNSEGKSDNMSEIYLFCNELYVLKNDVKMSVLFRLPTSMRSYKVSDDFLKMMHWEYYDGTDWHQLRISHDLSISIDDADADVIEVTFEGNNDNLEKATLSQFSHDEQFYIRATLTEAPVWLSEFCSYEVSIITNSNDNGVLPQSCFHNYEQLDMNNNFYPFGTRPTLDDANIDEMFYVRCDHAFMEVGSRVTINFTHSQSANYVMPKAHENLKVIWEYALDSGKWKQLDVKDLSFGFTQQGNVSFTIPKDFVKVIINAEDGFWIRAKIVNGNYGEEETSEYDAKSGEVKVSNATLNPPVFSSVSIKYSQPRNDISECYVFNNYKYEHIKFEKNKPVYFFKQDSELEESIYLGFDSYLSEQELPLYFDLENIKEDNSLSGERVLKWEILKGSEWIDLNVNDETKGLTVSGDVLIKLPKIESLEPYTLYIDSYERMWIRVSVLFSAMKNFPKINALLNNTVEISQQKSFKKEVIGYSNGLPDMKFKLDKDNLISPPVIVIDEQTYLAVERFIDYSKDDAVFRFNGLTGEIQFGDGVYGKVPTLGSEIIADSYSVSAGKKGNLPAKKVTILQEPINYVDGVENIYECIDGNDGDTIEELKRFAPSVLKTMQRAVSAQDYEHLSLQYSTFVKKAKCITNNGNIIVLIMNKNVLKDKGFIKPAFIRELQSYLHELSMITVKPTVQSVLVSELKIKIKLKYSDEENRPVRSILENEILEQSKLFFDPFKGLKGGGYPIGRRISKNDIQSIVTMHDSSYLISEIAFEKEGKTLDDTSVELFYNEIVHVSDILIEELLYDF